MVDKTILDPARDTNSFNFHKTFWKWTESMETTCVRIRAVIHSYNYSLGHFENAEHGTVALGHLGTIFKAIDLSLYFQSAYDIFSGEVFEKKAYVIASRCIRFTSSTIKYGLKVADYAITYFKEPQLTALCDKLHLVKNITLITSYSITIAGKCYDMYTLPEERTRSNMMLTAVTVCLLGIAIPSVISSKIPKTASSIALSCINLISLGFDCSDWFAKRWKATEVPTVAVAA